MKNDEWNSYIISTRKEYDDLITKVDKLLLECRELKKDNKKLIKNKDYGKTNKQE